MGIISILFTDPLLFLIIASSFVVALTVHEFAHAWAADQLGDPTPRYKGRISLNPAKHLDPLGTATLLLLGFGWGKPVEIDPYNLKNPTQDTAKIAIAGPLSNIALAILAALSLNFFGTAGLHTVIIEYFTYLNIMLAVFNLVPVAPLDGSNILPALLPDSTRHEYQQLMRRYGMYILILLLIPIGGQSPISTLIQPIIRSIIDTLKLLVFI